MQKKQILFINGGVAKENYINFVDYLQKLEYNPFEIKPKKWKKTFSSDLGDNYEVINPTMPNKHFADYIEWKIMFEKTFTYLQNDIILLGHSLGSTFLVKYLNENNFPKKIKKIFLVSGAINDSKNEVLGNFTFDKTLRNLKKYEKKLVFFHSKDDEVVPFSDLKDFKKCFPKSEYNIFEYKGHFIGEKFEELITQIKKI